MEMPKFEDLVFEEDKHIYVLNGIELSSVTTLMKPLSDKIYGTIGKEVLDKAARKGTAVHSAIETYNNFGFIDIDSVNKPYFDGYIKFHEEHSVKAYGSEIRLYHKELMYAGTADMIADVDGKMTLVDFKTSHSVSDMLCGVQLEAYSRAFKSHSLDFDIKQKAIVHLKKDGSYGLHLFKLNDPECWKVFTALITIDNYKKKFQ
ncbi:MAG: hypothetical protein OSJ43_06140 [Oscillospiraceae bacterium]|nr:hypothetical protein [Oscillospiraceae bacterium]